MTEPSCNEGNLIDLSFRVFVTTTLELPRRADGGGGGTAAAPTKHGSTHKSN